jgi:hypothetical protein
LAFTILEPEIPQQGKRNVQRKQIMNSLFDGKAMLRSKKYSQAQMPENTSHEKFNIDIVLLKVLQLPQCRGKAQVYQPIIPIPTAHKIIIHILTRQI